MKKLFLGLVLAGTMVSFTNLNANEATEVTDTILPQCCTSELGGNSVTICEGSNKCERALELVIIANSSN
ncbi:hypothetical protein [Aquimarina sp. RZ0]|uniref:hypothetical protein n=1 Tax=Aquimarina sp. RZ0 TaxID=2607730 RepID=UPI0011F29016|nr:hypothetical protein [Aquimarina sp. RZ0]KAA1244592.1 hypothetical protein F0000_15830 [Aquimarina sp. RZ0]